MPEFGRCKMSFPRKRESRFFLTAEAQRARRKIKRQKDETRVKAINLLIFALIQTPRQTKTAINVAGAVDGIAPEAFS